MSGFDDIISRPQSARPVFTFKVPAGAARENYESIGLVEITADEELLAAERAGDSKYKLAAELAKAALARVNGKPVSIADGSLESAWRAMPAKVRQLAMTAYGDIHGNREADIEGFLKSCVIESG